MAFLLGLVNVELMLQPVYIKEFCGADKLIGCNDDIILNSLT
jgi:hypothetical protein